MSHLRLNRDKIRYRMEVMGFTPAELARQLGESRQLTSYILKEGGPNYAPRLGEVLKCDPMDLVESSVRCPKGFGISKGKVYRKSGGKSNGRAGSI